MKSSPKGMWLLLGIWTQVAVVGLAAESGLQLVRVRCEQGPLPNPNLVANFSFEEFDPDGLPTGWRWDRRNTDAAVALDAAEAHSGRRSLRVTNGTPYGAHVYGTLWTAEPIRLQPGRSYTLSCFAKSEAPGVAWVGGGHQWRVRVSLKPTGGTWQRLVTTFTATDDEQSFRLQINTDSPTPGFWIDDLKLEEGEAPTFCISPPATELVQLSASPPGALGDGPWASAFECYLPQPLDRVRVEAMLQQAPLQQAPSTLTHETVFDLPAGLSRLVAEGAACRASPAPVELTLTLRDQAGKRLTEGRSSLTFFSQEAARARLLDLQNKTRTLQELIAQVRSRRLDPAYPLVGATVLENFTGYALDDLKHNEVKRAFDQLTAMERMAERTEQLLRDALGGHRELPSVPRYVTSPIAISGPSFLAETSTPGPAPEHGVRPVFFTGYGHFGQVCADLEKLSAYGTNIIQIELGPHAVFVREHEIAEGPVRNLRAVLDRAASTNVAVTLLISPHYMPGWMLDKYPELRKKRDGFLEYCLHATEGQELLRRYLEWLIPQIKDHPALHSICLSNEPVNVEEPCEPGRRIWQAWLETRHGDIGTLNRRWHTDYRAFDEVPQPNPFDSSAPRRPQTEYDFVLFNQEFFAGWHRQLADVVHQIAPQLPVHAKAMAWTFWNDGDLRCGVDAELFGRFSQINGNDSVNFYDHEQGEWAQGWQLNARSLDLQRSVQDLPVFNSENHLLLDRETREVPPQHLRAALWQAAVHGQSATTIWVWERTFDPKSDFAGSVMHRPACAEAVGHTGLDLLRLADEVTALQRLQPHVVLLYSTTALAYDGGEYSDCSGQLYQALAFSGLKIGFMTERQLIAGRLPNAAVLFVPGIRHLPKAAFAALQRYTGKVVAVGGDEVLTRDEYDEPQVQAAALSAVSRIPFRRGQTDPKQLWAAALESLRALGVTPAVTVQDAGGRPVWGVEWLTAQVRDRQIVNLINYRTEEVQVEVRIGGRLVEGQDLFGQQRTRGVLTLSPLEPVLIGW